MKISDFGPDFPRLMREMAARNVEEVLKEWGNPPLSEADKETLYQLSLMAGLNVVQITKKPPE